MIYKEGKMNISKKIPAILFMVVVFFFLNSIPVITWGHTGSQEEVTVTAIEVPVRVVLKGEVVRDLTQEDFQLYENGVIQKITAFEAVSRKIALPQDTCSGARKAKPEKRLFILIFNIFDYNQKVGESIDYFFENIFRPQDQVVIVTEDRVLNIERGKKLPAMIQSLKDSLNKYKVISTASTLKAYKDLRFEADRLLASLRGRATARGGVQWDQSIMRFYDNYRRIWLDYKRRFISPNTELYQRLIKKLKYIEGEKWALCFQQREMFPRLRNESPLERSIRELLETLTEPRDRAKARNIQSRQMQLQRDLDIAGGFPAEALKNIFMEGNITFHQILLKSPRTIFSKDFELKAVSQDYEDCFRQISFSTGGSSNFSNNVSEALQKAAEAEDYYYMLVYNPKDKQGDKKREIEVKVNKSGADITYLKKMAKFEAPPIAITGFKAEGKNIQFTIKNYKRAKLKGKTTGVAEIKITIFDKDSNKVFDEGRTLEMVKKETKISLNFGQLNSGQHFIVIQVVDKITNAVDVFSGNIVL